MWLFLILVALLFTGATLLRVLKHWNSGIFFLAFIASIGLFFSLAAINLKWVNTQPAKVDEVPIYFMKDVKTDHDPFVIGIKDISTGSFYFYIKDGNLFKKMDLKVEDLKVIDKDTPPMVTVVSKTESVSWFTLGLSGMTSYQIQLPSSLLK
jgi:hypothetical protein